MSNAPICGNHHEEMTWKTGTSKKTGKDYAFWSCGKKMPDGSWCDFKVPFGTPGPSPERKFTQSLDDSVKYEKDQEKDERISRLAIAKSLIEAGREFSRETALEGEKWLRWVKGEVPHSPVPEPLRTAPVASDEVRVEDIPF